MSGNDYNFLDRWRVEGDVKEVADIIEDALSLPRWWPSVYFELKELEPGGEHGIGKLISLRAGGWLPYTLRIDFRTVESRYPHGFPWTRRETWKAKAYGRLSRTGRLLM
jgi:hypothetical protein